MRTINTVPLKLHGHGFPRILEVRGEIYIPKKEFKQFNTEAEQRGEKHLLIRVMLLQEVYVN